MNDWGEFLGWAGRFAGEADLDAEEQKHKLAAAEHWSNAIDAC